MKHKALWGAGAIILLGIVGVIIWFGMKPHETVKVNVYTVSNVSLNEKVYANGDVKTGNRQDIYALNPGMVNEVNVSPGQNVKAGSILVNMDTTVADAQVAQAQANKDAAIAGRDAAKSNLDLAQKIPGNSTAVNQAKTALAQAEAALKQAQAGLEIAQRQRDQLTYKAAISGTILEVNAMSESPAPIQSPLVVLADLHSLDIEAELNEVDAGKVKVGQSVTIQSKVLGNANLKGKVKNVAPEATVKMSNQANMTPTVTVGIGFDEVPAALKPGYSVNIQILVNSKQGVLGIPLESVFQEDNRNFVYKVVNGKVYRAEVFLGIADDLNQEVKKGLSAEEEIVLNPTDQFYEGMPVQIETGSERG